MVLYSLIRKPLILLVVQPELRMQRSVQFSSHYLPQRQILRAMLLFMITLQWTVYLKKKKNTSLSWLKRSSRQVQTFFYFKRVFLERLSVTWPYISLLRKKLWLSKTLSVIKLILSVEQSKEHLVLILITSLLINQVLLISSSRNLLVVRQRL